MASTPAVLLDGLTFPEGPRWHDGRLWFSDFYSLRVIALGLDGKAETVVEVPGRPSGLGWLPDGRLLVVSMLERKLMRLDAEGLSVAGDLTRVAGGPCNDMVVDGKGRAYVGNFGYDRHGGGEYRTADMARVDPDGSVHVVARGLDFPNGTVITPDGKTLICGESHGCRLTAWDIAPDGGLSNQRLFADIAPNFPDGICLDAEGHVWCADPRHNECVLVAEGRGVIERISTGTRGAYACMLGGPERRTLFICTNTASGPKAAEAKAGRIEGIEVRVPGAGWP